jgi:hypothetical protein
MPTASIGRTHDCKRFQRASSKKLLRLGGHPHMTEPNDERDKVIKLVREGN